MEPGVTNLEITRQVAPFGYYYAPDPSSQQVCSIGGNVAENSGGAHCLKYGFTVHHVLAVEAVLTNGELVQIGSPLADAPGPDVLGLLIGSEGTLAVVTKAVLRILRKPESVQTLLAAFDTISEAGSAVSEIISAGIVPAAVEMMWQTAPGDYSIYNRCDSGEFGDSGCLFRGSNGTIQFTAERRADRWVVIQAFYSAP